MNKEQEQLANELSNMIWLALFGRTAEQLRKDWNLEKDANIDEYLTFEEDLLLRGIAILTTSLLKNKPETGAKEAVKTVLQDFLAKHKIITR